MLFDLTNIFFFFLPFFFLSSHYFLFSPFFKGKGQQDKKRIKSPKKYQAPPKGGTGTKPERH
ncbi:hypothetical protein BDQ94DRAFT_146984 [Aspergillus welwitschiae]|uniref:Uncharacterized protein n=1 Tax=Aspergillus welwitschiae TaxID=1341132 RepID=A0A3F3PXD0_9EURO|nr:hypothetical protein BDQ94DRAFT_146984 [Aspergillus welwitschiae]RDH31563.1 hypothetical protein BDQ94DRAFT_146984 [Aspergillus welwitschiae]